MDPLIFSSVASSVGILVGFALGVSSYKLIWSLLNKSTARQFSAV
jgi:hypothetical protein